MDGNTIVFRKHYEKITCIRFEKIENYLPQKIEENFIFLLLK